ncbi:hypothetical protein P171DRAFT_428895 [Karstenula rhodostoma CBS 690.94]|uniref:Apple domain-containing protein n=1 Tax=Karstenula rhodostoma CBS 690.94 TaxID=1392251 RepID=A0A9P4PTZ7_9PLEO|nr:hypothetical protein P171DRAFT_428895 [Karstenula rhodostoma CBS 690.94]
MSNLPEVASSPPGLEVDHAASAPGVHYVAPQYYGEQHQPLPSKSEYALVGSEDRSAPESSPMICGVRRSTFWLAIILGVVVVAAAVGGGVGGSLAVSNAKSDAQSSNPVSARETVTVTATVCSASGSEPTSTSISEDDPPYVPREPWRVNSINGSCPSPIIQNTHVDERSDDRYNCRESTDMGGYDIMWFTAYTLQACVDACSTYNDANMTTTPCKGVALALDMRQQYYENGGANCWLKSAADEDKLYDKKTTTFAWLVDG